MKKLREARLRGGARVQLNMEIHSQLNSHTLDSIDASKITLCAVPIKAEFIH